MRYLAASRGRDLALGAAMAAAVLLLVAFAPPLWSKLFGAAPPIAVVGSTVTWDPDGRSLRVHSGARTFSTSCPSVIVARWIEVAAGPPVYVPAVPLSGPLARGDGPLPPRREVAIEPGAYGPSELVLRLPDYVRADEALALVVRASVPDDKPCANGFTGSYDLYRLSLPGPPAAPAPNGR